ncbi:ferritin-like domain-containing protein [Corynebacterium ulceribovis]|uniref:ferritin-like domain-containing protein n=1 Tax=Corynebacterium ulceribovis TaxID=487732 RepID=UPI0003682368|nr:DUF2202 domain-containing protein [Corynebacterium ulceribovis]
MARFNNSRAPRTGARWTRTLAVTATAALALSVAPTAAAQPADAGAVGSSDALVSFFKATSKLSSTSPIGGGDSNTETNPQPEPKETSPQLSDELATLQLLQEEERMARDLYRALGEKWPARQFENIPNSEQMHMEQLGQLLDEAGVPRAGEGLPAGTYAFPELQALYDGWLERGLTSRTEAFQVGIELEKQDIADLEKARDAATDEALKSAYSNLIEASKRHLQAFTRGLNGGGMGPGHGGPGQGGNGPGHGGKGPGHGRGGW